MEKVKIGAILDHSKALEILQAAGVETPLPKGPANTAYRYFRTAEGDHALAINQTGFAPEAADNEEQVNGLTLLVLTGKAEDARAENILIDAARELLEIPRPRGGQPGNQNARSKDGELDGQFLLKLPQAMREAGAKAAKKTDDRHLSRMLRRLLGEELDRLGVEWRQSRQPPDTPKA